MKGIFLPLGFIALLSATPLWSQSATNTIAQLSAKAAADEAKAAEKTADNKTAPGSAKSQAVLTAPDPNTLTPAEWDQMRRARIAALKANPDLLRKAAALSMKMRAFQQKLDAAILKANPALAPVVAKIENKSKSPQMIRLSTKPH